MDAPDYMKFLETVARPHSLAIDDIGKELNEEWRKFEDRAEVCQHDVFINDPYMISSMKHLVTLLYFMPGADVTDDIVQITHKNREYGGSWCRRGGRGAFFMLARKWDRLEKQLANAPVKGSLDSAIQSDQRSEGILDDLGDLRRYLVLVLAWHEALNAPAQSELSL